MSSMVKLALLVAVGSVAMLPTAEAKTTLKMALIVPADSAEGKGALRFKELVEEKSNGELEITIFPGAQLGGSYEIIESQTAGSIEMALHGYDLFAKYSPSLTLASLAFIFETPQHAFAYYESPLHQTAKEEILENTGIRILGNAEWNRGPYKILLAKKPVLSTEDLAGMPMRVPTNEVDLLAWGEQGAGANTTPVPWPEAPLALRQGLVEAIELPADLVRPVKFYESAKYLVLTRHRYQALYNTIADEVWQGLSEQERQILLEAHEQAGKEYTDGQEANWAADQQFLKSEGVVIIDFDVSPWHDKVVAIARDLEAEGEWAPGLTDQLLTLAP